MRDRRWHQMRLCSAAIIATVVALTGANGASASTEATIQGAITATQVTGGTAPIQLLAGTDGGLWFVTAQSALGQITASGAATLAGITLPHGNVPATLAGAGPEGVWAYGNTIGGGGVVNSCSVTLVKPDGTLFDPRLPKAVAGHFCGGATADADGNLWISFRESAGSGCDCRAGLVAEITTAGHVTFFEPVSPGAAPNQVTLGGDGAIWVLEGQRGAFVGKYTSSSAPTGYRTFMSRASGIWARPDGRLWIARTDFNCRNACATVFLDTPGGAASPFRVFPVATAGTTGLSSAQQNQLAEAPDGSLWIAGFENPGVNRFYRMDASETIDRSAALPVGSSGSQLTADGPVAVTTDGVVWAVADDGSTTYVVRFAPSAG
jgi:streptogramin lyase